MCYGLLQLPNFNALFLVSLIAATMSISYSTIGWVSAVAEGKAAAVSYVIPGGSTAKIMGIFNGLGTMVFAYGGHSVVLEIQVRTPDRMACIVAKSLLAFPRYMSSCILCPCAMNAIPMSIALCGVTGLFGCMHTSRVCTHTCQEYVHACTYLM